MRKLFVFLMVLFLMGLQSFENPFKVNGDQKKSPIVAKTYSVVCFKKVVQKNNRLTSWPKKQAARFHKDHFAAPSQDELIIFGYSTHKKLPLKLNPETDLAFVRT